MANFTVIYDANILYPAPLRSILMYLGITGMFRACWTMDIHEEWIRNLLRKRKDLSRQKLETQRNLMIQVIPDSLVTGYESITPTIELPDPDDRHVLAAAIRANAEVIVTNNLKDFPDNILEKYNCHAEHPDEFITNRLDLDHAKTLTTFKDDRNHYLNPAYSVDEYLSILKKQGLSTVVSILEESSGLI